MYSEVNIRRLLKRLIGGCHMAADRAGALLDRILSVLRQNENKTKYLPDAKKDRGEMR